MVMTVKNGIALEERFVTTTGAQTFDTGSFNIKGIRIELFYKRTAGGDLTDDTVTTGTWGRSVYLGDVENTAYALACSNQDGGTGQGTDRWEYNESSLGGPRAGDGNAYDSDFRSTVTVTGTELEVDVTTHSGAFGNDQVLMVVTLYGYECELMFIDHPSSTGVTTHAATTFDTIAGGVFVGRGRGDNTNTAQNNRGAVYGMMADQDGAGSNGAYYASCVDVWQDARFRLGIGGIYTTSQRSIGSATINGDGDLEINWTTAYGSNVVGNKSLCFLAFNADEVSLIKTGFSTMTATGTLSMSWNHTAYGSTPPTAIDGGEIISISTASGQSPTNNQQTMQWVYADTPQSVSTIGRLNAIGGAGKESAYYKARGTEDMQIDYARELNFSAVTTEGTFQFDGNVPEVDVTLADNNYKNIFAAYVFVDSSIGGDDGGDGGDGGVSVGEEELAGGGKRVGYNASSGTNTLYASLGTGYTLSEGKFTLSGVPLTMYEKDGRYAIAIVDDPTASSSDEFMTWGGIKMELALDTSNRQVLRVVEGSGAAENDLVWNGITLGTNANNQLMFVQATPSGEEEEVAIVTLGGAPLKCVRYGAKWYLSANIN